MSLCRNRELDEEPSRKEPGKFPAQDLTVLKVVPASKSQSSLRKGKKRNTNPKSVKFKDRQDEDRQGEVIQNTKEEEPIIKFYGINDDNNNVEKIENKTEENKSEDSNISGIQFDGKLEREKEEEKEKKLNIANIDVPKKEEEKLDFSHDMNTSREEINNDNKKYYENINNNNNEENNNNNNINEIKDDTKEKDNKEKIVEKENENNPKNDEKQNEEVDKEIEKKEDNKSDKEAIEEVKKNNEPINIEKNEDKKTEELINNDKIKENKNEEKETSTTSNTSNAINNEQNKNINENAPKVNEPKKEKVEEEEYDEEEEEEEDEKDNETKGKEQTEESKDKELLKYKSLINIIKVNLESKGYSKSELINKLEELFKTFPNPTSKEDLTSKISEHFINLLELTIDSDKNELRDFIQVIIKLFDGDKDKIYQQLMSFMEGIEEQEKLKNRQSNRVIRTYIKDCEEKLKNRLKQEDIPSDKIISLQKIEKIIEETGVQLKDEHLNIL